MNTASGDYTSVVGDAEKVYTDSTPVHYLLAPILAQLAALSAVCTHPILICEWGAGGQKMEN